MRFLLHAAAVVLFVIAAVLAWHQIDGSTIADALCFGFAGLACWSLSTLPNPPAA